MDRWNLRKLCFNRSSRLFVFCDAWQIGLMIREAPHLTRNPSLGVERRSIKWKVHARRVTRIRIGDVIISAGTNGFIHSRKALKDSKRARVSDRSAHASFSVQDKTLL